MASKTTPELRINQKFKAPVSAAVTTSTSGTTQPHEMTGELHYETGLTVDQVLLATGPSSFAWALLDYGKIKSGWPAVTGSGALGGGGTINGNQAITMNTPGSLSVASANSASTNHTHAIASSSNPGAAASLLASTAAGGLTLQSLNTNGAATIGQDLYSGASAFRVIYHTSPSPAHVHVVVNPTGGWTLDEQFGVDIDDNLLVRGWIVGKHAIQLKDAVLIAHFDGGEPVETDFTGEANGHMGQPGVMTGATIFRPSKFGKGLQTNSVTTNGCPNPSCETNITGWSEQYDPGTVLSIARNSTYARVGVAAAYMTSTAASSYVFNQPHFHAPDSSFTWNNGEVATLSAYVQGFGTWRVIFEDAGQNLRAYQEIALTDTWQRVILTVTNSSGSNYANCKLAFMPMSSGGTKCIVDAVQYEKRAYATAYFDGSFGGNYAWSGTANNSTSATTTAGKVTYSNVSVGDQWTAMIWAYREAKQAHNYGYLFQNASDYNSVYYQSSNVDFVGTVNAGAPADGWHHYVLVADGTTRTVYRDGALIGTATGATAAGSTWLVGGYSTYAADTVVDEFVICGRALSADEVRTIYESDAPVFAETSTWHFRAGKNLVWADSEGLWMLDTNGYGVLGAYGDSGSKGWGGLTLNQGDIVIGDASRGGYLQWDNSAAVLNIAGKAALIEAGATKVTLSPTGLRLNRESSSSDFGYNAGASIEWTGGYNSIYGSDFVGYLGAGTVGYRTLVRTKTTTTGEYALATLQAELYTGAKATIEARAEPGGVERVDVTADELRVVGRLGVNSSATPPAQAGIYQSGSAAAIPTLLLDQSDVSEEFIEFSGTVAAGNPIDTAALGTYYGKVRVSVNGTFKYMALYS